MTTLAHIPGKEVRAEGEQLGLLSLMEEASRGKQASGTRASTKLEDIDPTSSASTAKHGAQHSKNDASKEVTKS
jgi:hypothetical protein